MRDANVAGGVGFYTYMASYRVKIIEAWRCEPPTFLSVRVPSSPPKMKKDVVFI